MDIVTFLCVTYILATVDALATSGIESVERILLTHHHRDQTCGARSMAAQGAKIGVPAAERAELLAALAPVDFVVVFEGDSPADLLTELRPHVHCKGTDYGSPEKVPEFETVRRYGGRTVLVGDPKDHATTDVIGIILERFGRR